MTDNGTVKRVGPRPLPLHLANALSTWMSAAAALPGVRSGEAHWHPGLKAAAERLLKAIPDPSWPLFEKAVAEQSAARIQDMMDGIKSYQNHPYHRKMRAPEITAEDGSSRLYRYAEKGLPVLIVPSLINPAYILDLTEERSLIRGIKSMGLCPYLVDWGRVGEAEQDFGLTGYVLRLERFLSHIREKFGKAPSVIGYCMGGNLALALAARQPPGIGKLALLATPWDFHEGKSRKFPELEPLVPIIQSIYETIGCVPVDILQIFFASLDPSRTEKKFRQFSRLDPDDRKARLFVAVEDWANSGEPLAGKVAMECLEGWYLKNEPGRGVWKIDGETVNPAAIRTPVFMAVPQKDRIVPEKSALALAGQLPQADLLRTPSGHIGMIVGSRARQGLWRPLADWFLKN